MINLTKPLGLYIHIPFCASKCRYCDFYSVAERKSRIDKYIKALCLQIKEYGALCEEHTVDTIYFGGGTPSLIGEKRIVKIIAQIYKNFYVAKNVEITVEANPDSMSFDFLSGIKKVGVNRLSVGIQSANNNELRMLGRIHTWEQAKDAIKLAQKVGFDNISIDLMYALPNQTMEMFDHSINEVLALNPTHLSCYGLKLEPNTEMGKENPKLPDDDIQADMYLDMCEKLEQAGFEQYEISNFARDGKRSKHNSKYWDLSEYLGLGTGAHSYLGGKRFGFIRDIYDYCENISDTSSDILEPEEDIEGFDSVGEYLMLRLRTADGISEYKFEQLFNVSFEYYAKRLNPLINYGLVQKNGDIWRLTSKGFFVSNSIINLLVE